MKIIEGSLQRETTIRGQKISFLTRDIREADKLIDKYREKPLEVVIRPQKRSKNANDYMWVLCEKIAKETHQTKTDVYREAIRQVGVFHDGAFQIKDIPDIKKAWESNGEGWFTTEFDSQLRGCKRIRFYHGSSLYDTAQMSRLIDYVVDAAKDLGIETMTPKEIYELVERWEK